ncbi:hypothetical protein QZH41_007544 [Actinostola sp. cb2023]|nr:hypothetical protein QZH41_007544 [Actinostola sp. cb2023]
MNAKQTQSAKAAQQMGLITINKENFESVTPQRDGSNVNQLLTVKGIVQSYPEVFESQLGSFPGKVHLEVDENVSPTITPTRRIPTALKEKFKQELDRMEELGVVAKVEKPTPWFRLREVTYMGHVFTDKGLKIDPEKVKAVQDMPRPTDVEAVHRLNGFVNYLAKFLPKLADSMEPIRRLTHKDVDWVWGEDQEKTFAEVKRLVTSATVLSYYDPDSDLVIQCDASQKGLGAVLFSNMASRSPT